MPPRHTMSSFFHHRPVVNTFRLIWVLAIVFYEYGIFLVSVRGCNWPDDTLLPSRYDSRRQPRPFHVLLVADPQIVDHYSYPNRLAPLAYLTRLVVDLNMRKNWRVAFRKQPDAVVFLGDLMDNGRLDISDEEYESLFKRFLSIFKSPNNIPVFHIPGNHDINLGRVRTFKTSSKAYERYVTHFGAPNYEVFVANHTLILFDAPKFVDEDLKRHGQRKTIKGWKPIPGGSWAYLKEFSKQEHPDPVILFSHIPLYRPDGKSCGPLREQGTIRPGTGEGYQNTLEKQSTGLILDLFKPIAIFSGDDHDYCEYNHRIQLSDGDIKTTREVSVKSISMVMNVRRPGFQLLSLAPADLRQERQPTHADTPCLLPDQMNIYLRRYLPLIAITFLAVFFSSINNLRRGLTTGRSQPVLFCNRTEDGDLELDEESSPPYRSPHLSLYSQPSTPRSSQKRTPRSLRGRGWQMFQAAASRRESESPSLFSRLRDTLWIFWPSQSSATSLRRRRLWSRWLRDIRDIAVFSIFTFAVMTWWVVMD